MPLPTKTVYDITDIEEEWDRPPILEHLSIGTHDNCAKSTVFESLQPWLDELGLHDKPYRLDGPPMGRNFTLKFTGTPGLGAKRAKKANVLLRNKENNTWREMSTTDPEGTHVRIYVSPDKSPKYTRERQLCKRLLRSFNHAFPGRSFYFNPRLQAVCLDGKPLATVVAKSFEQFDPKWKYSNIEAYSLDKEPIATHFASITGLAPEIEWEL